VRLLRCTLPHLNTEISPPGADGFDDGNGGTNAAFNVEI
jgi:hypothetical protein